MIRERKAYYTQVSREYLGYFWFFNLLNLKLVFWTYLWWIFGGFDLHKPLMFLLLAFGSFWPWQI